MEILKICLEEFVGIMYKLFAAWKRMECATKGLDVTILISIYKRKGMIQVPDKNRSLRLILILRKTFEMETTVKLVKEFPDEVEQHGFKKKSMALISLAMVLSADSLHYVMTILLDLIKAYDLAQRDQVMAIVDK